MSARGTSKQNRIPRISGRPLTRIRARHFRKYPLCVHCEAAGRVTAATQLDHIIPLSKGGDDIDVESNRQGLCKPCHDKKTAKDMGHNGPPRKRIDVDGFPVEEQ